MTVSALDAPLCFGRDASGKDVICPFWDYVPVS